jgi:hypothetical protein
MPVEGQMKSGWVPLVILSAHPLNVKEQTMTASPNQKSPAPMKGLDKMERDFAGAATSPKCGEYAGDLIAGSSWFACVRPKGHPTDSSLPFNGHQRGGNCFVHGEYIGDQCPKWPECIKSLTTREDADTAKALDTVERDVAPSQPVPAFATNGINDEVLAQLKNAYAASWVERMDEFVAEQMAVAHPPESMTNPPSPAALPECTYLEFAVHRLCPIHGGLPLPDNSDALAKNPLQPTPSVLSDRCPNPTCTSSIKNCRACMNCGRSNCNLGVIVGLTTCGHPRMCTHPWHDTVPDDLLSKLLREIEIAEQNSSRWLQCDVAAIKEILNRLGNASLNQRSAPDLLAMDWRVGGKNLLNVYFSPEWQDSVCQCHSPEMAALIVKAVNQLRAGGEK